MDMVTDMAVDDQAGARAEKQNATHDPLFVQPSPRHAAIDTRWGNMNGNEDAAWAEVHRLSSTSLQHNVTAPVAEPVALGNVGALKRSRDPAELWSPHERYKQTCGIPD